ncbi:MAG: heavy-metal-associated domain-containing protein [Eubacteriales bacterium]|jgi:copper chaperone CopZ|nr:heavy-metal-associated domain-containing protein [Eubacteriales bacterium]
MTVLNVPDMHCESCLARITNAFDREKVKFSASLNTRTVAVQGDEATVQKALELLDELGFDAAKQED